MGCICSNKSKVLQPESIYRVFPKDQSNKPAHPDLIKVQDEYMRIIKISQPSMNLDDFISQLASQLKTPINSVSINYTSPSKGYRSIRSQKNYEEVIQLMKFQKVRVNVVVKNDVCLESSNSPLQFGMFKLNKVHTPNGLNEGPIESHNHTV